MVCLPGNIKDPFEVDDREFKVGPGSLCCVFVRPHLAAQLQCCRIGKELALIKKYSPHLFKYLIHASQNKMSTEIQKPREGKGYAFQTKAQLLKTMPLPNGRDSGRCG